MSMLNKIYLNERPEEGVVEDQLTNDYKYYDKLIVMDYDGNILFQKEKEACLSTPTANGTCHSQAENILTCKPKKSRWNSIYFLLIISFSF